MRHSLVLTASLSLAVLPSLLWAAEAAPSRTDGEESLGSGLLDDLDADLPANKPAAATPKGEQPVANRPGEVQPRFEDLGEDIGVPSGPLSLVRVREVMQQAESLLAKQEAAADEAGVQQAGAVQQQVVDQLDKLIAELSKQCQCCGQCQGGGSTSKPGPPKQGKSGKPKTASGKGQTAARDSTTQFGNATKASLDKGEVEELTRKLWGHLPERDRERMMQSFSEEFLPEYEADIEQYYLRLSEEGDAARSR